MVDVVVNVQFRTMKSWKDSRKRSDHIAERMIQRGIGIQQIKDAITKGAKKLMDDKTVHAEYRWYRVIYKELMVKDIKKVYPITVIEL